MLRSYTVTFACVTYRLVEYWLGRWMHLPASEVAEDVDSLLAWASWVVPLMITEAFIQLRTMRRRVRGYAS